MIEEETKSFPEWNNGLDYFIFMLFKESIIQFGLSVDGALSLISSFLFRQEQKKKAEKIANYLRKKLNH